MVHRDPDTGQFVSGSSSFHDVEVINFAFQFSVAAAQNTGATDQFYGDDTDFEGVLLYDLDDIVDRHAVARVLEAQHALSVQPTGTQTADSATRAIVEISSSPSSSVSFSAPASEMGAVGDQSGLTVEFLDRVDDSLDVLGRPLEAMAQGPFTDGTNGLGGGGGPGHDSLETEPHDFILDRRDEMFLNGAVESQNLTDGPATFSVVGQHVLGINEE